METITLPAQVATTVINACKQSLMATTMFLNLSIDEQVKFLASMQEYAFFNEMIASKTMQEITHDIEVQKLVRSTADIFETQKQDLETAIKILSNE